MIALQINETTFVVKEDISILEACKFVGIKMPRFCYHDTLSIAGNCRMCLIRLESEDKFFIACLTKVEPYMEIITNDAVIKKIREEILEFLLLDHPLDCPICDQGGECDLQDQAKNFGAAHSKYYFNKVGVEDKNFGFFIKTIMTRCIHCTRCVRFSTEIAGVDFFGTLNRGNHTEIGTYHLNSFNSEISGNVIDLCPVGALTAKPYAFKARPWELKSVETIDLTDSLGSNIYVNFTETSVARVLPKYNSEINENIITDKTRFFYDSFSSPNTLISPLEYKNDRYSVENVLDKLLTSIKTLFKKNKSLFIVSDHTSYEILNLLKLGINSNNNSLLRSLDFTTTFSNNYNFFYNSTKKIKKIKESLGYCFLFAVNPRMENALINAKIRFLNFNNYYNIYSFGNKLSTNYDTFFVNFHLNEVLLAIEGKSKKISSIFITSKNCLVISGNSLKERGIQPFLLQKMLKNINNSILFFNIYLNANSAGIIFNFIKPLTHSDFLKSDLVFLITLRETIFLKKILFLNKHLKSFFWFNTHRLNFLNKNVVQIPVKNVFEENNMFLNMEFRPQMSQKFLENKTHTKSIFSIFSNFFKVKKTPSLAVNDILKEYIKSPEKFSLNNENLYSDFLKLQNLFFLDFHNIQFYPVKSQLNDFYKTNYFTDYSKNMLLASREYQKQENNFFKK